MLAIITSSYTELSKDTLHISTQLIILIVIMAVLTDIFAQILGFIISLSQLLYWYVEALYRQFVPPAMKSVDGETILVTGAVGGIGKEICRHLVRSGRDIKLVLWDLEETSLEKFAKELRDMGKGKDVKVFHFAVDISTRENINSCCKKVKDTVGPISIIFNNAGIAPSGNLLMLSDSQVELTFQVNLMSHLWILRQLLPDMISRNHGRIVSVCSIAGLKAGRGSLPYCSSKFGVEGYSEALRIELAMFKNDGIRVTTVYPWFVKTPMIGTLEMAREVPQSGERDILGRAVISGISDFLEPEYVGRTMVEGMRREYEYMYLPRTIPLFLMMDFFIPTKFRKLCQSICFNLLQHRDPEQQRNFSMTFSQVVNNGNDNNCKGRESNSA